MDLRALVFDVFGTVVDWRSGVAREVARLLPDAGDPFAVADDWRARYQPSMEEVRSGRRGWINLDGLHRESLDALLADRGLVASDDVRAELVLAWHRLDPWPDAVAGLTRLRTGHVIGPLSNGNVALLVDMAKRAGLPWDVILGAEVAGYYKPDPRAYDSAPALLALPPQQVGLVAAHVDDLVAARARGLATIYLHRPGEFGDAVVPPASDPDADLSVASLTELADHLGC